LDGAYAAGQRAQCGADQATGRATDDGADALHGHGHQPARDEALDQVTDGVARLAPDGVRRPLDADPDRIPHGFGASDIKSRVPGAAVADVGAADCSGDDAGHALLGASRMA